MAASTVTKHFTDGSIVLSDGTTPTPVSLTVAADMGDFSVDSITEGQREAVPYQSRGVLHAVRKGAKVFASGSLSFMLADVSDATDQTVIDFVLAQASYSANKSTRANDDVYCFDIKITIEGTEFGDTADHTITMNDCHCTMGIAEGSPDTVSISFTCYGDIDMT